MFEGIYQRTYPSINAKKSNSNEELVQVGEDILLVGEDGGEIAVEEEDEGSDEDRRQEGEEACGDCTNVHS